MVVSFIGFGVDSFVGGRFYGSDSFVDCIDLRDYIVFLVMIV